MKAKKIEIILQGGIGNQLLQYAYGRSVAQRNNLELILNTYRYGLSIKGETPRNFGLEKLSLPVKVISESRLVGSNRYLDLVLRKGILSSYKYEGNFESFSLVNWGYWMDSQYADAARDILISDFKFREGLPSEINQLFSEIKNKKVLAIHVRRGDYVTNAGTNKTHGVLPVSYYKNSIAEAKKKSEYDEIWFFTDDPEWVKANFPFGKIIKHQHDAIYDIFLMAKAQGMIISNSTFSWWAAWLNNGDQVIAPTRWFVTLENPPMYSQKWKLI